MAGSRPIDCVCNDLFLRPFPLPDDWLRVIGIVGLVSASITALSIVEALWTMPPASTTGPGHASTKADDKGPCCVTWTVFPERRRKSSATYLRIMSAAFLGPSMVVMRTRLSQRVSSCMAEVPQPTRTAHSSSHFVWKALLRRKKEFPKPTGDTYPWRRPWYLG